MGCKCKIIILGKTNKYLLLILVGSILLIALAYVEYESKFFAEKKTHPIIYSMTYSLGLTLSFIFLIIYKIRNKWKNKNYNPLLNIKNEYRYSNAISHIEINSNKKKFLWILLISGINYFAYIFFSIYWINLDNYFNTWGITLVFMSFVSYFILQKKLYKHHYLSIISVVICGFIYNLFMGRFNKEQIGNNYVSYLIQLMVNCLISLGNVFYKFLMEKIYINPFKILFIQGLIELILGIITLIITTSIDVIDNFIDFIDEVEPKDIIVLFSLILIQFLIYLIQIIIINIFSPFHILLIYIIKDFIAFFIYYNIQNPGISLYITIGIGICICIFMLLVFTEIIELNFLGLSKMTKRNIELRAQIDSVNEIINDDITEKGVNYNGYIIELEDPKNDKRQQTNTEVSLENLMD